VGLRRPGDSSVPADGLSRALDVGRDRGLAVVRRLDGDVREQAVEPARDVPGLLAHEGEERGHDSPPDQLIAAINVVASGDVLLAPSITRRLVEEFVHRPTPRERPPELPSDSERIPATASDVARAAVVIVGSKEYRP